MCFRATRPLRGVRDVITVRARSERNQALSPLSRRGLLEVYEGWTEVASAGDQEEVY